MSNSPEPKTAGEEETRRREKRQRRFEDSRSDTVPKKSKPVYTAPVFNSDVIDWDEYTIVGTSTQLEKNYLRLTSVGVCWLSPLVFDGDLRVFYFCNYSVSLTMLFFKTTII